MKRSSDARRRTPSASRTLTGPARRTTAPPATPTLLKLSPLPRIVEPQLARLIDHPPRGENWIHEVKFDGYRMLARIERGRVDLISRNQQSWTAKLGSLVDPLAQLPVRQAILDGEVVVLDRDGVSNFQQLQNMFRRHLPATLTYYAFDLLHLDGRDLRPLPLEERKELLAEVLTAKSPRVRFTTHVAGHGPQVFEEASRLGLEGIISKRRDRPYTAGRGPDWLKVKCISRGEFVIGGFTAPSGSRSGFGALLLGHHDDMGQLRYAGRVGTGFDQDALRQLRVHMETLIEPSSPFSDFPVRGHRPKGVTWIRPSLVAEVAYANWTDDGYLRHATFKKLQPEVAGSG